MVNDQFSDWLYPSIELFQEFQKGFQPSEITKKLTLNSTLQQLNMLVICNLDTEIN